MALLDTPLTRVLVLQGRRRDWMAARLGIRPWTFSKIEAGVQPAPTGHYERAAEILGVPLDAICPEPIAERSAA